jgi:hypothetical protein
MGRNSKGDNHGHPIEGADDRAIEAAIGSGIHLSVRLRRAAPEQERRFGTAVDALLSELVRRELSRRDRENG